MWIGVNVIKGEGRVKVKYSKVYAMKVGDVEFVTVGDAKDVKSLISSISQHAKETDKKFHTNKVTDTSGVSIKVTRIK